MAAVAATTHHNAALGRVNAAKTDALNIAGLEIGLRGARARGLRIIAGNHDDADAGGAAFLHGCRYSRAQRIRKADEAKKLERKFARCLGACKTGGSRCARNGEHAHAFPGHLVDVMA